MYAFKNNNVGMHRHYVNNDCFLPTQPNERKEVLSAINPMINGIQHTL